MAAAVVVLAAVGLRLAAPIWIEKQLRTQFERHLAVPFAVEGVGVSLFPPGVTVRGVEIANPEGFGEPVFCRVEQATLRGLPWKMGSGAIDSIELSGVAVHFERITGARRNIDEILRPTEGSRERRARDNRGASRTSSDDSRAIRISHIAVRALTATCANREATKYSGEARLTLKSIEATGFHLRTDFAWSNLPLDSLVVEGLQLRGPMTYPDPAFLSMPMLSATRTTNGSHIDGDDLMLHLAWNAAGESNTKRLRRIVKSTIIPDDPDEEDAAASDAAPLDLLEGEFDYDAEELPEEHALPFLDRLVLTNAALVLSAQLDGEAWQSERMAVARVEADMTARSFRLEAADPQDATSRLAFESQGGDETARFAMQVRRMPFHALMWASQLDEKNSRRPRVHRALASLDARGSWQGQTLEGEAATWFEEVDAEPDTRSLLERLRLQIGGNGWAALLNDMADEQGTTEPVRYDVRAELMRPHPLAVLSIFRQEFHRARIEAARQEDESTTDGHR